MLESISKRVIKDFGMLDATFWNIGCNISKRQKTMNQIVCAQCFMTLVLCVSECTY